MKAKEHIRTKCAERRCAGFLLPRSIFSLTAMLHLPEKRWVYFKRLFLVKNGYLRFLQALPLLSGGLKELPGCCCKIRIKNHGAQQRGWLSLSHTTLESAVKSCLHKQQSNRDTDSSVRHADCWDHSVPSPVNESVSIYRGIKFKKKIIKKPNQKP